MKSAARISTPKQYLTSLPEPRRTALTAIHKAIRSAAPGLKPSIQSGMLGYGTYHYEYASGREGDAAVIGLASQKNHISLYLGYATTVTWPRRTKAVAAMFPLGGAVSASRNSKT